MPVSLSSVNVLLGDGVTSELVGDGCAVNKETRVLFPSKSICGRIKILKPYKTFILHSAHYVVYSTGKYSCAVALLLKISVTE